MYHIQVIKWSKKYHYIKYKNKKIKVIQIIYKKLIFVYKQFARATKNTMKLDLFYFIYFLLV